MNKAGRGDEAFDELSACSDLGEICLSLSLPLSLSSVSLFYPLNSITQLMCNPFFVGLESIQFNVLYVEKVQLANDILLLLF